MSGEGPDVTDQLNKLLFPATVGRSAAQQMKSTTASIARPRYLRHKSVSRNQSWCEQSSAAVFEAPAQAEGPADDFSNSKGSAIDRGLRPQAIAHMTTACGIASATGSRARQSHPEQAFSRVATVLREVARFVRTSPVRPAAPWCDCVRIAMHRQVHPAGTRSSVRAKDRISPNSRPTRQSARSTRVLPPRSRHPHRRHHRRDSGRRGASPREGTHRKTG